VVHLKDKKIPKERVSLAKKVSLLSMTLGSSLSVVFPEQIIAPKEEKKQYPC
jgi:hypothetical protein